MDLNLLPFNINFDSFHTFLITNIPHADGIVTTETGYIVIEKIPFTSDDITAIQTYYNSLTQSGELAKSTPTETQLIASKILTRIAWGQQLMANFGAQNILAGYTTNQVAQIVQDLGDVQSLIQSGSLETANSLILNLTPTTLITQITINNFSAQIVAYLAAGG